MRTREEIETSMIAIKPGIIHTPVAAIPIQNMIIVEVLLDIRDLLSKRD